MLILILKSQAKKIDFSDIITPREVGLDAMTAESDDALRLLTLVQEQLNFFKTATQILADPSHQLPFDLLTLSLDVFSKL